MKYPQLVSMPSAVQNWLDEELEARGIDAVVYTRYILSLLQRDTLDLPDDLLTSKSKEVGRRGRKRGRREDYWDVWDCERLKRSAAVECLMSASDQKCGIEKLVDELCAKLKEIQNEGENVVSVPVPSKQSSTQSLQEQVHKYYAAFPPLNSKPTETNTSVITLIPDRASAWVGNKSLTSTFAKNTEEKILSKLAEGNRNNKETALNNMKYSGQLQGQLLNIEKEVGYGFAWNMASERNEIFSDFCPVGFENNNSSDLLRVFKCNKQNQGGSNGNDLAMKSGVCRRLYERQSDDDEMALEKIENMLQDNNQNNDDKYSPKQGLDDNNLAQLIAKFDHSIEAIWNPEDASQSPNTCSNSDEVLPLDFQQLLSSPSEQLLTVELCSLNNKHHSENNSFIQCGTNIINSIWSDNPSKEQEESGMDCAIDQIPLSETFKEITGKKNGNGFDGNLNTGGKLPVVLVDGEIGGESTDANNSVDFISDQNDQSGALSENVEKVDFILHGTPNEKSKFSLNKLESYPSLFTSMSWGNFNYSLGGLSRTVCNRKWSDIEHESFLGNYSHSNIFTKSCFYSHKPNHMKNMIEGRENYDFSTLNHNREDSSFTEVIPKNVIEPSLMHVNDTERNTTHVAELINNGLEKTSESEPEKDEEDLLTSNRTHFRPIRQESLDTHNTAGCYADGTTFAISNNLEKVLFKRSESGALYLENDVGAETPKKYMEYKEKEPYGGRHKCDNYSPASTIYFSHESNFVPKFRVKQTEKWCQTEAEEILPSDEEIDPKRSRQDKSEESEHDFYFPGDDQFAEKLLNCLEDDVNKYIEPCLTCCHHEKIGSAISIAPCANHRATLVSKDHCKTPCGNPEVGLENWSSTMKSHCNCNNNSLLAWNNGWFKTFNPGLPNEKSDVWKISENEPNKLSQPWYDIWCSSPGQVLCPKCCGSSAHAGMDSGRSLQYCRLRKELSEDGEQLLSDLSYLQHLYLGSDWLDEQGEQELLPPQKLQCLSPSGESSHELQLYDDESRYTHNLVEYRSLKEELNRVETKSVEDFLISPSTLPKEFLLSTKSEAECKLNERPFNARTSQKDRKRRHSASQRTCNFYLEGNCERSHDLAAVPCQFWADSSCLKGLACSSFHGCVRAFRPVTL